MAQPRTLSTTIGLYVGSALLAFTVLLAVLLGHGIRHVLDDALQDKANALVRQLSLVSLDAVLVQDYGVLERYTADLALEADLNYLKITRNDGVILAQAGTLGRSDEDGALQITQPMELAGGVIGHVTVSYDRSRIEAIGQRFYAIALGAVLLLVLLLFLVLRNFTRRRLVEPVRALTEAMNPLTPGTEGLEQRGGHGDPLEVHQLRQAFEEMRGDVRRHLAEIERANSLARTATQRLCQGQRLATIGQMAAGLAHGLNTPLGNIIGYAQLAQQQASDKGLNHQLEVIEQQAHSCSEIVRNMLCSVRAPEVRPEHFDLLEQVRSTRQLIHPLAKDYGAELVISSTQQQAVVWADVASVEQIIFNLVSNAVHAGADTISHEVVVDERGVALRICDNGRGIETADQSAIFEPFFTTKPASQGTGLGLYLCATLADSMAGKITLLHSRPGETCFELLLPCGEMG